MKILNVIVFYNNLQEVEKYIDEVFSIADGKVDIAVVVNSDLDNCAQKVIRSNVSLFDYKDNVGYLNSLLLTIQKIDVENYDYCILSNTDIHYGNKEFFDILTRTSYDSKIGCIAPSVYATKTKSYSNPHYIERISKRKLNRLAQLFKFPMVAKIYLKLADVRANFVKKDKKNSRYVYSPHGCYMIFTHNFIQKLKGYVYGVKMYSEESCIGELLRQFGYKCFYDSNIEIDHRESSVTGKINYKQRFSLWRESLEYIINTFYIGD